MLSEEGFGLQAVHVPKLMRWVTACEAPLWPLHQREYLGLGLPWEEAVVNLNIGGCGRARYISLRQATVASATTSFSQAA